MVPFLGHPVARLSSSRGQPVRTTACYRHISDEILSYLKCFAHRMRILHRVSAQLCEFAAVVLKGVANC